jgi:hypothetical protein
MQMLRSRFKIALLVAVAIVLLSGGPSQAAQQTQVVADCNAHGQLTRQYSLVQLRGALATIPPAIKEYTNCYDVIQRQLLAQLAGTHGGGGGSDNGSGGSFLPLPVIIILAALVLAAGSYAVVAVRRRGSDDEPPTTPPVSGS